ncbi:hypothetical protein FIBSPDRAFT_899992 [Athelia psychrophila]|uniref:Uncharacterized protein n=1 Tax=Athelia psychrophila TaxID=1759441 RepID=A0A165Z0M2_9AGAM|nr:hypothetical protein FIBSPDRAFT_899992 [Fibularhizoctonia sp. CBS 109695]
MERIAEPLTPMLLDNKTGTYHDPASRRVDSRVAAGGVSADYGGGARETQARRWPPERALVAGMVLAGLILLYKGVREGSGVELLAVHVVSTCGFAYMGYYWHGDH